MINKPWSIQIELTEGCTRLCGFCGLNGIRNSSGKFKFMMVETAKKLLSQCAEFIPNIRYEFACRGEPTINPEYLKIISMFRWALPKTQMQITMIGYFII